MTSAPDPIPSVVFYWRPGCMFCRRLEHDLARAGVQFERHNIWEDDDAAAFVRSVARGNETVPTVVVGDQPFVNPPVRAVIAALGAIAG